MAKDNTLMIRLSDEENRILNNGWFDYVKWRGHPVPKAEYVRECIKTMYEFLNEKGGVTYD